MIARADIVERVHEWQLTEEVIEKDYVLGWLLWGIATDPVLGNHWVFKGGTCLKKCYIETYRFSEDLDFTVLPGGPLRPEDVAPQLARVLAEITETSGIDFSARQPALRLRFAATNHLLVELGYQGSTRVIEPYALRRSRAGRLLLHAERADGSGHRTYGVDTIAGLRVTTTPFRPRYPIEFSARGPLHAPPQSRSSVGPRASRGQSRRVAYGQPEYIYACNVCGREFAHSRRNSALRKHNNTYGYPCRGRSGRYVGTR